MIPALYTKPSRRAPNRETWLLALARLMEPRFAKHGAKLPAYRVTLSLMGAHIGECYPPSRSGDRCTEILIRIDRHKPEDVAQILCHEMIHAAITCAEGHGKKFRRLALLLGLQGKMTATEAGPEFKAWIAPLLKKVGPLPHAPLKFQGGVERKPQTNRQRKIACSDCGYTARASQKWIDVGLPTCPCGHEMEVAR